MDDSTLRTLSTENDKRMLEKYLLNMSDTAFQERVNPSLWISRQVGNMYCGSLFAGLASLFLQLPLEKLVNSRIGLFAYGSGSCASLFSLRCVGEVSQLAGVVNTESIRQQLMERTMLSADEFEKLMAQRERAYNAAPYLPQGNIPPKRHFLVKIDQRGRREYEFNAA